MKRTLTHRVFAFLLGASLVFAVAGEAYGLHACPHHDDDPAAEHHGSSGAEHHGSSGDEEHDGPCTCVGLCHGAAAAPIPGAAPAVPTADGDHNALRAPGVDRIQVRDTPYLLPYATGPPPTR